MVQSTASRKRKLKPSPQTSRISDRRSVLIADHDQEITRTMKLLLERNGYELAIAADGEEALRMLSERAFDLIIMETRMPKYSGIEVMEEIASQKIGAPVIFFTAYGEVESYLTVMNMGAFEYLHKPIKSDELMRVVTKALNIDS